MSKYWEKKLEELKTLNIIFGGRGTGKTYNILKQIILEKKKFIWLRDRQNIVDIMKTSPCITSPIERNNSNFPHIEYITASRYVTHFAEVETTINNNGSINKSMVESYGYLLALSTFHNLRGVEFSDVEYIIFDEFIPEKGTQTMSFMGETFLNMYETVNRNRELEGKPPVIIIMLTNANDPFSEVLAVLGVDTLIEDMEGDIYIDDDIYIEFIANDEFKNAKKQTFLYRIAKSNSFVKMALDNEFTVDRSLIVKNIQRAGTKNICNVGDYACIQMPNGNIYFYRGHINGAQCYNVENPHELMLFRYLFTDTLRKYYITGKMKFDSIYTMQAIISEYAKLIKK